jgi:hypothetical protein
VHSDLLEVLQPGASPFVRNFCIAFLDVGIPRLPNEERENMARQSLARAKLFPVFSPASDALLNYTLMLLPSLDRHDALLRAGVTTDIFTDLAADVLLVQSAIGRDAPGSVQSGISVCRAARLTSKLQQ